MKKTRLHTSHIFLKARMVEFFGWEMPIEYSGIIAEHMAVREKAGLFDVSHMGEIEVSGKQALDFVQHLTPNNAARLSSGMAQYSALTTPEGTFVDDLLVYYLDENHYLLVVNAANIEKDHAWISEHSRHFDVTVTNRSDDYSQIALQGPDAEKILKTLSDVPVEELMPFRYTWGEVAGIPAIVSRTGYTGEDGFELYTTSDQPQAVWDAVMDSGKDSGILPVGLGARDTLRMEAVLMLYGNDIDDTTTVLEAGLGWLIKFKKGNFLGREALLEQKESGIQRKLVGFEVVGRGIARPHYPVAVNGDRISEVTSGSYAPYLKKNIGMTYLPVAHSEVGTEIEIEIRGRMIPARIVPIPFYKRGKD